VKLRGRAKAQAAHRSNEACLVAAVRPDGSRGRTLSPRARGDTTDSHGPLQRLLDRRIERRTDPFNLSLLSGCYERHV
jgi:hypothetical protein